MATKSEMDALADQLSKSLNLDSEGQPLTMEQMVYTANPEQLEFLRKQVFKEQIKCGFDDETQVKNILEATKPPSENDGAEKSSCNAASFQNQIMMPCVVDSFEHMPKNLLTNWLCIVCPEGSRVLVVATGGSTRVYDLWGVWICEHDTHLPGGSSSNISKVDNATDCTILDCLYNDEQEVYYVVDVLCWRDTRYYKQETSVRIRAAMDKLKRVPTLKHVLQTNPFRFYTLPVSFLCEKNAVCNAIARADFSITGLLFYHKRALYLPGLNPLGVWVQTIHIPRVLDIWVSKQENLPGRRNWKKNRYEMRPAQYSAVHNAAYSTYFHTIRMLTGRAPRGSAFPQVAGSGDYSRGFQHRRQYQKKKAKVLKNPQDKSVITEDTTKTEQDAFKMSNDTKSMTDTVETEADANNTSVEEPPCAAEEDTVEAKLVEWATGECATEEDPVVSEEMSNTETDPLSEEKSKPSSSKGKSAKEKRKNDKRKSAKNKHKK